MAEPLDPVAVSIVVEWETGADCAGDRASRGLAAILAQADAHRGPTEVLLVCDPGAGPSVPAAPPGVACRVIEAPQPLGYYEKKNFGFGRSTGAVVVFVDSDLLPERGWLEALLRPFADPATSAVVGRTHFDGRSLYERAMALFWIFDARLDTDEVRRTGRLVSNNIAFRRPLFAAFPFPLRSTYRNQCSELGGTLARLGIALYEATGARAVHPAPAGVRAFVTRAARAGQDARFYAGVNGGGRFPAAWHEWRQDLARVARRIAERAPLLRSGGGDRIAAAALGFAYYSVKAAAYVLARQRPSHGASKLSAPA